MSGAATNGASGVSVRGLVCDMIGIYRNGGPADDMVEQRLTAAIERKESRKETPEPFPPKEELIFARAIARYEMARRGLLASTSAWSDMSSLISLSRPSEEQPRTEADRATMEVNRVATTLLAAYFGVLVPAPTPRERPTEKKDKVLRFPVLGAVMTDPVLYCKLVMRRVLLSVADPEMFGAEHLSRCEQLEFPTTTFRDPDGCYFCPPLVDILRDSAPHLLRPRFSLPLWSEQEQTNWRLLVALVARADWVTPDYPGVPPLFRSMLRAACRSAPHVATALPIQVHRLQWFAFHRFILPDERDVGEGADVPSTAQCSDFDLTRVGLLFSIPLQLVDDQPLVTDFYVAVALLRIALSHGVEDTPKLLTFIQRSMAKHSAATQLRDAGPILQFLSMTVTPPLGMDLPGRLMPGRENGGVVGGVGSLPNEVPKLVQALTAAQGKLGEATAAMQIEPRGAKGREKKNSAGNGKANPAAGLLSEGLAILFEAKLQFTVVCSELLSLRAATAFQGGDVEQAKRDAEWLVQALPTQSIGYLLLARVSERQGSPARVMSVVALAVPYCVWDQQTFAAFAGHISRASQQLLSRTTDTSVPVFTEWTKLAAKEAELLDKSQEVEQRKQEVNALAAKVQTLHEEKKEFETKIESMKKSIATKERSLQSLKDSIKKERARSHKDSELNRTLNQQADEERKLSQLQDNLAQAGQTSAASLEAVAEEARELKRQLAELDSELEASEAQHSDWLAAQRSELDGATQRAAEATAAATKAAKPATGQSKEGSGSAASDGQHSIGHSGGGAKQNGSTTGVMIPAPRSRRK